MPSDRDTRLVALYRAKRERDTDVLLAFLGDPDHRHTAASALGELGDARAVKPLLLLLRAADVLARSNAATALADLKDPVSIPPLKEMAAGDQHEVARAWAVEAVGRLGGSEETNFLVARLDDAHVMVRHAAALALGRLGDPSAIEPLERAKAAENWRNRKPYRKALAQIQRNL
jgi:HEAT repeat protein